MTDEARFFAGDVMAQHWSNEDGGVATMAATKKKSTKKPKPKPTKRGPGCGTGKKTC